MSRGQPLKLLEEEAGLPVVAGLGDPCGKPVSGYKKAAKALSEGRTAEGWPNSTGSAG